MKITLAHGGGGEEMQALIFSVLKILQDPVLDAQNDAGIVPALKGELAISTDSFVLDPLFINGADIGKLAVCGSVNDVCMVGGDPSYLSLAFIIEEGLELKDLEQICLSIKAATSQAGVRIVCGDTKVVPKQKGGGLYINTTCIGSISHKYEQSMMQVGDVLIASRDLGAHAACVLACRNDLSLELQSDCKLLKDEVKDLYGLDIHTLRDATRGGLSAVLNEWAQQNALELFIEENDLCFSDEVLGVCELFGYEPWELACEGAFIACVGEKDAKEALKRLKSFNKNASIIGRVKAKATQGRVLLRTAYGSVRVLEKPKGELLPRIC